MSVSPPGRSTCPPWCRHTGAFDPRTHYRPLWDVIVRGDVDFSVELVQDGGQAPRFVFGRFPAEGTVDLTVGQVRALRDALSEALRMLAADVG